MRKFLSLLIALSVLLSALSVSAYAEPQKRDPLNNNTFTVVAPIKDYTKDSGHNHGEMLEMHLVNNYPGVTCVKLYKDGCRISEKLLEGDEYYGSFEFAGPGYPAYRSTVQENRLVRTEEGSSDDEYVVWHYLVRIDGSSVTEELIATEVSTFNEKKGEREYEITLYSKDKNGKEVKKVVDGCPMSYEEYSDFVYGEYEISYNDGLIYKSYYTDETIEIPGYYDINGKCQFVDGHFTYYGISYNLGYFLEVFNNGGTLDWSGDSDVDPEELRRYETTITNSVNGNAYYFENTDIDYIRDNGYAIMRIKDDKVDQEYLIKLKRYVIPTVFLNGEKLRLDQIPVIEDGRTLVPVRSIFEALGADVTWDDATKTVRATKGSTKIKLTVGSKTAYKNGEAVKLEVPAKIVNGRTLVPVRFIADSFGVKVKWNGDKMRVELTK